MARYCGIWRLCYGWCLLFCIFQNVEASTRVPVTLPSVQAQAEGSGAASIVGSALQVLTAPLEGEYIAASTKNVPVTGILGGTSFGLSTIIGGTKSLLKGGIQAVAIGSAIDLLVKGVGWVMDSGGNITKPGYTVGGTYTGAPRQYGTFTWSGASFFTVVKADSSALSGCNYTSNNDPYFGFSCFYSTAILPPPKPVISSDITGTTIDNFVNSQNASFVQGLLKQVCQASINPGACYTSMAQQSLILKGPSSVAGPSTTTTTTVANSDGTTSAVATTNTTNYALTYGPDYFDYSKSSQSSTTTNGKQTSSTTTSDASATTPTDQQSTDSSASASPCGGNCDGPAYQKLYQPTTDTKEGAIDSYATQVSNLPILKAATGFFNVTAGGSCPVWSVNTSLPVMSASMPINLVFDFHCQSWFVSVASYASSVMSIVCAYLAFRQAFLD